MKVLVTERAENEIQEAHDWWAANRSPAQAARWYRQVRVAIASLNSDSDRHPLIPEHEHFRVELRQLACGIGHRPTHRIVFLQRSDAILVLTVRHLAQRGLTADDIP